MAEFYNLFMRFMIVGLMVISVISFIVIVQETNDSPEKIINDPMLNESFSDLTTKTSEFGSNAQSIKKSFEDENPITGFGSLIFYSIVSGGKIMGNMVSNVFTVLIALPTKVLGIDPMIISFLTAMLVISIIIGLWIIYKIGG